MVTFAEAAANRDQKWSVMIRIEGVGDASGQWTFCSQVPNYATDAYKPWLAEWPDILSERADIVGGLPEAGDLTFSILDYDDRLTSRMGMEQDAVTVLAASIDASTTTVTVGSDTNIVVGDPIWIGNEAMFVVSNPSANTLTVSRGKLGTEALPQIVGAAVHVFLPYLRARKVELVLVPTDGGSSADEVTFGSYYLRDVAFSQDLNVYEFAAKGQLNWLHRLIPRTFLRWNLVHYGGNVWKMNPTGSPENGVIDAFDHWPADSSFSRRAWLMLKNEEIILVSPDYEYLDLGPQPGNVYRAQINTARVDQIKEGLEVAQVMVADMDAGLSGSFRWSAGPSPATSRAAPGWIKTDNPIDILLCILTSAYDPLANEVTELLNYNATYGNWSSLPAGFGIGIPHTKIDWPRFLAVRDRVSSAGIRFPNLYYGNEVTPAGEWITKHILRPLGAYLTSDNGLLAIAWPRLPNEGLTVDTIDADEILREGSDRGDDHVSLPRMDVRYSGDVQVSSIAYKSRGRDGSEVTTIASSGQYRGSYGRQGYYQDEANNIEVEIDGRPDSAGFTAMVELLAMRRLFRFHKPSFLVTVEVDMSWYGTLIGDVVGVSLNEIPEFYNATRGWADRFGEVIEREVTIDDDGGARLRFKLLVFAHVRIGLIAPSAYVASIHSGNTVNVTVNRYTDPANNLGLAVKDVSAFAVNDVVGLHNLDLSSAAGGTATITAIDAANSRLTLSGNFGGALAADKILRYASRLSFDGSLTADQKAKFVALADSLDLSPGSSTDRAWRYGEP